MKYFVCVNLSLPFSEFLQLLSFIRFYFNYFKGTKKLSVLGLKIGYINQFLVYFRLNFLINNLVTLLNKTKNLLVLILYYYSVFITTADSFLFLLACVKKAKNSLYSL